MPKLTGPSFHRHQARAALTRALALVGADEFDLTKFTRLLRLAESMMELTVTPPPSDAECREAERLWADMVRRQDAA